MNHGGVGSASGSGEKDINHIRRGSRGDYWHHQRWGDGRIGIRAN
jgi:hypothetical protein